MKRSLAAAVICLAGLAVARAPAALGRQSPGHQNTERPDLPNPHRTNAIKVDARGFSAPSNVAIAANGDRSGADGHTSPESNRRIVVGDYVFFASMGVGVTTDVDSHVHTAEFSRRVQNSVRR